MDKKKKLLKNGNGFLKKDGRIKENFQRKQKRRNF
jgi:hypothetical protein